MLTRQNLVIFGFAFVATAAVVVGQEREPEGAIQLPQLLQQREFILTRIVDVTRKSFEQGETTLEALQSAESKLLDAQLDAATTREQRIRLRQKQVANAREREKAIAQMVENALLSPTDLMSARVNRLNAEIALLREKSD